MKLVNYTTRLSAQEYLGAIKDHNRINEGVAYDEKLGKPAFKVKTRGNRIRVSCTFVGGNNRDDGYIVGTYFIGRFTERDGTTTLKGVVVTSPLFHLVLLALTILFIFKCLELGGFSVVPPIFLLISILMFRQEYKKQGIIKRYLYRAKIKTERASSGV